MLIEDVPSTFALGVKAAVKTLPVPLKVPKAPLFSVTSLKSNPKTASEKVKVMVAVSPAFKAVALELMVTVGNKLSIEIVTVLLADVFAFPAASVILFTATSITPFALLLAVGVNSAV
jgi:hypothetical protein